jgi:hypothetical protein
MIALWLIIVAATCLPRVAELSDATLVICCGVEIASFLIFLLILPFDPLFAPRKQSPNELGSDPSGNAPQRFQFRVAQLIGVVAASALICWFAALLGPLIWGIYHPPTNAEMAERFRRDAARWYQLAADNPSLAPEYLRLADKSNKRPGAVLE